MAYALDLESADREGARATFGELAASAPEDALHRESLSRLAFALGRFGKKEKEAATALLRKAQRAHPDDFWINYDLARSLMGLGRPDEAVGFFTAAVAVRPASELARRDLRSALRDIRSPGTRLRPSPVLEASGRNPSGQRFLLCLTSHQFIEGNLQTLRTRLPVASIRSSASGRSAWLQCGKEVTKQRISACVTSPAWGSLSSPPACSSRRGGPTRPPSARRSPSTPRSTRP